MKTNKFLITNLLHFLICHSAVLCRKHLYPFCWLLYGAIQNEPTWKEKFLLASSKLLNHLMDTPQTSATGLLSHRSEPALLLLCILVVISTYAKRVKSPKDPLSCPQWSVLPPTTYTSKLGSKEVAAPKELPPVSQQLVSLCCPSTPFQALFITGIWNGFISASLGKMEMKTTKWISSGMWKCWCSDWLKTRIARIQSWLCFFFFGLGYDKTHTKVRRGLLKIPIIFWQKAHCVITLRLSHRACPHWKF